MQRKLWNGITTLHRCQVQWTANSGNNFKDVTTLHQTSRVGNYFVQNKQTFVFQTSIEPEHFLKSVEWKSNITILFVSGIIISKTFAS